MLSKDLEEDDQEEEGEEDFGGKLEAGHAYLDLRRLTPDVVFGWSPAGRRSFWILKLVPLGEQAHLGAASRDGQASGHEHGSMKIWQILDCSE